MLKGLLIYPLLEVRIGPGASDRAELQDGDAVIQVKGSEAGVLQVMQ